jgi:hypothetical protein
MRQALAIVLCLAMPTVICSGSLMFAQTPTPATPSSDDKPRVFITDSQSWEIAGGGGGTNGSYGSHVSGGARPQTAEIVKTFGERCSEVVTNNKQDRADYIVVLDHEGGKGVLRHRNKVAVFNRISGDSVMSKSTLSLGASVQDACEGITADWTAHSKDMRAAEAAASAPPQAKVVPVAMPQNPPPASSAQLRIASTPDGADIEIDGNFVGTTPSTVGVQAGQHKITIKKSGFNSWERQMTVSNGDINVNATLEVEAK